MLYPVLLWPGASAFALALALQRGEPATLFGKWVDFGVMLRMCLVEFVRGFATVLGCLLFVVPGVYLLIIWSQAPALIIDARATSFEALEDSKYLTEGSRGAVAVLALLSLTMAGTGVAVTVALARVLGAPLTSWTVLLLIVVCGSPVAAVNGAIGAAVYNCLLESERKLTQAEFYLAPPAQQEAPR
jgi:hypothetical protein